MTRRALAVRERYEAHERRTYGRPWSLCDLALGLVGDVGDLAKLLQAREGVRKVEDAQARLEHELADVLWSVIVIAHRCDIELESGFSRTMDELDDVLSQPT
jgi:NTP pyrophosphatase (non-canonical NTP hydrolase)